MSDDGLRVPGRDDVPEEGLSVDVLDRDDRRSRFASRLLGTDSR
jgi:hypothetical protein